MDSLPESVMEDLDYEKLIDVLQSHPAIWNMADPDYSNKIKKDNCWNDVCKVFYDSWDDLSLSSKKKSR